VTFAVCVTLVGRAAGRGPTFAQFAILTARNRLRARGDARDALSDGRMIGIAMIAAGYAARDE